MSAMQDPDLMQRPLTSLRGVGSERAALLERLGLRTVGDLLRHRPRRHEDRRRTATVAGLDEGQTAVVRGRIVAAGLKTWKQRSRSVYEFILEDGSARLHCRWWNLPYMEKYFKVGEEWLVYGKLTGLKPRTMDHPETELVEGGEDASIHLNRLAPVYPLTEGINQRWLRALVWRVLAEHGAAIPDPWPEVTRADGPKVPDGPGAGLAFPALAQACRMLHFPEEPGDAEIARQRLALDEFSGFQVLLRTRRLKLEANAEAIPCAGDNRLIKPFLAGLRFTLTPAQTSVLREVRQDLAGRHPMRRLLQGDVGSGKTVVAACAALMAMESGYSVVLMAPTEILAEQHYQSFLRWFGPLGVAVELQTGSRKTLGGKAGAGVNGNVSLALSGPGQKPTLVLGTHALIEDAFGLERLGLVIIDEQHKFGVSQREALVRKGRYPHLLVMTATPIPRSLGLTLYGDLDLSVIDSLPPGRGVIRTHVRAADRLPKVWDFVRSKLAEGRQAYVVYPRVEEADLRSGLKAVTQEVDKLRQMLAPHRVDLLHGRMAAEEKDRLMDAFRANAVQVLVATSVIEVGVDVANATLLVVENAEQFGLAQLHQLRGRIGRGAHESHCILVAAARTEDARRRLKILEETTDGFRIAEEDLRLRGPGELLGRQQSGAPPLQFGDFLRDRALVDLARGLARARCESGEGVNE